MTTTLAALKPGQSGIGAGYAEFNDGAQRLMQMGIIEGTPVEIIRLAPAGDPVEIRLMGYSLSLRNDEAANVLVGEVR